MSTRKNAPITLSGDVYDRRKDVSQDDPTSRIQLQAPNGTEKEDALAELAGERLAIVRVRFLRGDVALFQNLDMYGKAAVDGGHANYGYSGYFRASVFDGKKWRKFKFWNFVPESDRNYSNQSELATVRQRIVDVIRRLKGRAIEWGDGAYELGAPAA